MPPLLSVCIPTWNRAASLRKTLDSLAAAVPSLPPGALELCVSDNASSDGTPAILAEWNNPGLPLRSARLPENGGFSANYWSVARLASGKFTWITGDDDAFEAQGLKRLVTRLEIFGGDLALINNAPWKPSVKHLPDQPVDGLEGYFAHLGVFHGSFIGNSVFRTEKLQATPETDLAMASAYPHMSPVYRLLREGRCVFWNIQSTVIDDSARAWRARQPLFTSVDMARLVSGYAFARSRCRLATRLGVYALLMRSLPRAITRASRKVISVDAGNPFQSLSLENLRNCYSAAPGAPSLACLVALAARCACLLRARGADD